MTTHREDLMKTGQAPHLKVMIDGVSVASPGAPIKLDINNQICTNTDKCTLQTQIAFQCKLINGQQNCFAAYRISSLDKDIPLAGFGAKPGNSFAADDFDTPIAFDRYLRTTEGKCTSGFMTGYNRHTGEIFCTSGAGGSCGGVDYLQGYTISGSQITAKCLQNRTVSCPAPYVISSASFYPSLGATCVFPTEKKAPLSSLRNRRPLSVFKPARNLTMRFARKAPVLPPTSKLQWAPAKAVLQTA